jgi:hypothetical protein
MNPKVNRMTELFGPKLGVVSQLENCYLIGFQGFVDTADLTTAPMW